MEEMLYDGSVHVVRSVGQSCFHHCVACIGRDWEGGNLVKASGSAQIRRGLCREYVGDFVVWN